MKDWIQLLEVFDIAFDSECYEEICNTEIQKLTFLAPDLLSVQLSHLYMRIKGTRDL